MRYTIKMGKYGAFFYDELDQLALSLEEVAALLNMAGNE